MSGMFGTICILITPLRTYAKLCGVLRANHSARVSQCVSFLFQAHESHLQKHRERSHEPGTDSQMEPQCQDPDGIRYVATAGSSMGKTSLRYLKLTIISRRGGLLSSGHQGYHRTSQPTCQCFACQTRVWRGDKLPYLPMIDYIATLFATGEKALPRFKRHTCICRDWDLPGSFLLRTLGHSCLVGTACAQGNSIKHLVCGE